MNTRSGPFLGIPPKTRARSAAPGSVARRLAVPAEDEARDILRTALATESRRTGNLAETIRGRVAALGGIELEIAPREPIRDAPVFPE